MILRELIAGLSITPRGGDLDVRICDVTEDSRTAMPGSLFIARAGLKNDGRKYVGDAVYAGAVAVLTDDPDALASIPHGHAPVLLMTADVAQATGRLAERFYGEPSSRLSVAAVTGTNGKTTTSWILWSLLNAAKSRCGLVGTVVVDDGRERAKALMTTPPAIELSRTLAVMLEHGCASVAMEASSHALEQGRLAGLQARIGIFTNLTQDHLDYHGTMERYAGAKAKLFSSLGANALAIVNDDDPAADLMLRGCKARVLRCRVGKAPNDGCGVRVTGMTLAGMRLELSGPWGTIRALSPLVGEFNAMNILQAVAAASALGVTRAQIAAALPKVSAPPGRLQRVGVRSKKGPAVFVDYAHTDDALRRTLSTVRAAMKGGTLWAVFGCGGDRDKAKRPKMGLAVAELADRAVVTSDNPRTEDPRSIIDQVLAGVPEKKRATMLVEPLREAAIGEAIARADESDTIVIAGKGHETEQILPDGRGGTISRHFDDAEVALHALAARKSPRKTARKKKTPPARPRKRKIAAKTTKARGKTRKKPARKRR